MDDSGNRIANWILHVLRNQPVISLKELLGKISLKRGYANILLEMQEFGVISIEWNGEYFRDEDVITLQPLCSENQKELLEACAYRIPIQDVMEYLATHVRQRKAHERFMRRSAK